MLIALACAIYTAMPQAPPAGAPLQLEIRVFDGLDEITADAVVKVYPAGRRDTPALPAAGRSPRGHRFELTPGTYDVQAAHKRPNQPLAVRWAERLSVMRYPDEEGRHLEVINLRPGFGALQVRVDGAPARLDVSAFTPGQRQQPVGRSVTAAGYVLLVAPAGSYDIRVQLGGAETWWLGLELPLDRTRMRAIR
jgi:hypothetical protein